MSATANLINVTRPEFWANPYDHYTRWREDAPVYRAALSRNRWAWMVTRYDDVVALMKDERFAKEIARVKSETGSTQTPWLPGFLKPLARNMLDLDDPDHARLRNLVHKAFTPRVIEDMRGRLETLTHELLDRVQRGSPFDIVQCYALPVPMTVIIELLGIPHEDHAKFHHWSSGLVSAASAWDMVKAMPSLYMFMRYLRNLIKVRRNDLRDDLVSALIKAEEAGDSFSEDELLAMIVVLLIAGHETTVNLIASGTLTLLQHPEQLERLRSDQSLLKPAVDELLRFTSPVANATERYAIEDITLHGVSIKRGELVLGVLASANRDPLQFSQPDVLDLSRDPNRHLAFGTGIHYCLGAPLARLEGQIAFWNLIQRFPKLRLAADPSALKWRGGFAVRALKVLPVIA
jgi:cytochrome P450 PksS